MDGDDRAGCRRGEEVGDDGVHLGVVDDADADDVGSLGQLWEESARAALPRRGVRPPRRTGRTVSPPGHCANRAAIGPPMLPRPT